jgi:uncharacterized damage-inducible protein DinB
MSDFTRPHFQTLFAYHWHVTQRLLDAAGRLDPAAYLADTGYGYGSIHSTLVHLRSASHTYLTTLQTGVRPRSLDPAFSPDLAAVCQGFAEEQAGWDALLERLTSDEIESPFDVQMRDGSVAKIPRWHLMQQVILHGMQHHAELARLLTEHGQSPGDFDFLFFVR